MEELLAPLTSAADLPTHPSLSIPYTSKTLTNMTDQACSMLHRERKALYAVKNLLTKLRGDESYIPCGALGSEIDSTIFDTEPIYKNVMTAKLHIQATDSAQGDALSDKLLAHVPNGADHRVQSESDSGQGLSALEKSTSTLDLPTLEPTEAEQKTEETIEVEVGPEPANVVPAIAGPPGKGRADVPTDLITSNGSTRSEGEAREKSPATIEGQLDGDANHQASTALPAQEVSATLDPAAYPEPIAAEAQSPMDRALPSPESLQDGVRADVGGNQVSPADDGRSTATVPEDVEMVDDAPPEEMQNDSQPAPHRMTTRAQAQAASDNSASSRTRSASPETWTPPAIHPLYQLPDSAYPDRDLGLPAHEAEETRRVLTAYVQKQEEVVRGAAKLYEGLLRADRMRKTVFKWCKAEGHIGEMSDGEDWYDKEEWALEEDLKKGHEDEEEEVVTQGKKTRKTRTQ